MTGLRLWITLAICACFTLTGMTWMTVAAVDLETRQTKAERAAVIEERTRLALWRLEAATMPLRWEELTAQRAGPAGSSPAFDSELVHLRFRWSPTKPLEIWGGEATRRDEWTRRVAGDALRVAMRRQSARQAVPTRPRRGKAASEREGILGDLRSKVARVTSRRDQAMSNRAEWDRRSQRSRESIQRAYTQQRQLVELSDRPSPPAAADDRLGVPSPGVDFGAEPLVLWLGDALVFAQPEASGDVLGSWIDWPTLQARLAGEIADLFPHARLEPRRTTYDPEPWRSLVSLPVTLSPGNLPDPVLAESALDGPLGVAWAGAGLGLVGVCFLVIGQSRLAARRDAFVTAVTHELRTPLTSFRMYAEMLEADMASDAATRKRYASRLVEQSKRLSRLVENVLGYARSERGRDGADDPSPRSDASQLLAELVGPQGRLSEELELTIEGPVREPSSDAAWTVAFDPDAFAQIVTNLLENVEKYGRGADDPQPARVQLSLSSGRRQVVLRVRDFGPGIARHERRAIFAPFVRGERHRAGDKPGVGLGLSLCRRLARRDGGDLRIVDSSEGACFELSMPRA